MDIDALLMSEVEVTVEQVALATPAESNRSPEASQPMEVDPVPSSQNETSAGVPNGNRIGKETRIETDLPAPWPPIASEASVFSQSTEPAPFEPNPSQTSAEDGTSESQQQQKTVSIQANGDTHPSPAPSRIMPRVTTVSQAANSRSVSGAPQIARSTGTSPVSPSSVSPFRRPASPAKMVRTGYIYDPLMMLHCHDGYQPTADNVVHSVDGHPEEPMRIKRIFSRLAESGLIKRMKKLDFSQVTLEQVLLVHTEDHWNKVQGTESMSFS